MPTNYPSDLKGEHFGWFEDFGQADQEVDLVSIEVFDFTLIIFLLQT